MEKWKIDVNVLIIFFNRSITLEQVFTSVREAKPRRLLLWQDGPRANRPDDIEGIKKCRAIAENIDWDCEVYKSYHDKNMGCDPSTFYADKWAFSIVDKCIILEDDQVPSQSFYLYCKELLDKYEFDTRISHINGHNFIKGFEDYPYDYLYCQCGTGAWASWRRVADQWNQDYSNLDFKYDIENIKKVKGKFAKEQIKNAQRHRVHHYPFWESVIGMNLLTNSMFAIVPKVNMVQNVGVTDGATHSLNNVKYLPKAIRYIFTCEKKDIEFPLKHPPFICLNYEYEKKRQKLLQPNFLVKLYRRMEIGGILFIHGEFKLLFRKLIKK